MVFIFFLEKIRRRRNSHDSFAQVHRDKEKPSLFISFNKFFCLFSFFFFSIFQPLEFANINQSFQTRGTAKQIW